MIVILTALNLEHLAVRRLLSPVRRLDHPAGTVFEVGESPDGRGLIALAVTGEGNTAAAILAERAIAMLRPQALIFVGIAGALRNDIALGDVVIATKVYSYHSGEVEQDGFRPRPRSWQIPHQLDQVARRVHRTGSWTALLPREAAWPIPAIHFSPVAAGEVVLKSGDDAFAEQLRRTYGDAAAIEMEGAGVAQAAHFNHGLPMLSIRGISDRADSAKYETDRAGWPAVAAANAAAFAMAVAADLSASSADHDQPGKGLSRRPDQTLSPSGYHAQAATARGVAAATRTLPRDIAGFTGREPEFRRLADSVADDVTPGGVVNVWVIGGMAGIGKTAFAVHAAHQLATLFPDGQIFLPLHGHTPGERPVDPADAIANLLLTAGVAAQHIPPGIEARTRLWRDQLAGKRLLLLLDDAIGHDQVRPLLPGTSGTVVMVTSRRHLTALDDTHTITLGTLPPDEATELLIRLADRPDLDASNVGVEEITRLCGHLPLAIGMLARQLHYHPSWTIIGLAAELTAARDRLEFMHAENLSAAAAFDLSYQDLTEDQQRLFRRLGLHLGTDIDVYAAAALAGASPAEARRWLEALFDHNLLTEPAKGRYRLHDLIREYARTLSATEPADSNDQARSRLLEYYLHTARIAGLHLTRRPPTGALPVAGSPPAYAPDLPTRETSVAWMTAERLNLHAAASYAADHDLPHSTIAIAATMHGFLRALSYWDQALVLHGLALDAARHLGDNLAEARALADLGDSQYLSMSFPMAMLSLGQALALYRDLGDQLGEASVLSTLGMVQQSTGDHLAAAANQQRALELYRQLDHRLGEATALNRLGWTRASTGDYAAAADCQEQALNLYRDVGERLGEAWTLGSLGNVHRSTGSYRAAGDALAGALALFRGLGSRLGEADALNDLGRVHQATGDYPAAAQALARALTLFGELGSRLGEANALIDLGRVHQATSDYPAAADALGRALTLNEQLGRRFHQAQVLNALGDLALAAGTTIRARAHYDQALAVAVGIGSLAEEANALEGIGRCQLRTGFKANLSDHGDSSVQQIIFESGQRSLSGSVFVSRDVGADNSRSPGILFAHGLGSDSKGYQVRARALVTELRVVCLTFDLSGHGQSAWSSELENLTPRDHLDDLVAAYDELARNPYVDKTRIGVCGASYGGYISALLPERRSISRLLIRAPAIYSDQDFDRPLTADRRSELDGASITASSLAKFAGEMLILESGADEVVSPEIISDYLRACPRARHEVIPGASHRLIKPEWETVYRQAILNFFSEL